MKPTKLLKKTFGRLPGGEEVSEYFLTNKNGVSVHIINYGAIITSIIIPDKNGVLGDIVLGFDRIEGYTSDDYLSNDPYIGGLIGRYANRITKGKFILDGKEYILATNNRGNHMHGGKKGFDKVIWDAAEADRDDDRVLLLNYHSKDGDEGYPGNLDITVAYSLNIDNELRIDYTAETDKATPITLTNHSYFNFTAEDQKDALEHLIMVNAESYIPVNEDFIPLNEIRSVKGTPMDFLTPQTIGSRIKDTDRNGYNHVYILKKDSAGLPLAAKVYDPLSGREMEVYTTEPGLIFYSGNFLDGRLVGKKGIAYSQYYGFAMETQHFPDSPNHPEFPSTILRPGEIYHSSTVYKFSAKT